MKKRLFSFFLCAAMLLGLSGCGSPPSSASPDANNPPSTGEPSNVSERTEPLVLRFGATGSGNEDDNQWLTNREIIAQVEEETNGMITFEYYPSQQLGSATSMLDQVLMGTLGIAALQPNVAAAIWPEFNVLVFPFAYPDLQVYWDSMLDDTMYDLLNGVTAGKAVYLGVCSASYRGCQNNQHPIRSASDLQGLKFRVQAGEIYADIFAAMGASTASIAAGELYAALQQGVVNAEENPVGYCYDNGIYECAKYATELNCVNSNAQLFMATETWNKLTDSEKEIFQRACREHPVVAQTEYNKRLDEFYQKFTDAGIEVIRNSELTEEERQSFQDAVMPVWDKYIQNMDPDFYAKWCESMKAAWEKNGYTWTMS